jgi:hypothetical protein
MANHRKSAQPVIPVTIRKFSRQWVKSKQGNDRIQRAWKRIQIKKYGGLKAYVTMRLLKTPHPQRREVAFQLYNT